MLNSPAIHSLDEVYLSVGLAINWIVYGTTTERLWIHCHVFSTATAPRKNLALTVFILMLFMTADIASDEFVLPFIGVFDVDSTHILIFSEWKCI